MDKIYKVTDLGAGKNEARKNDAPVSVNWLVKDGTKKRLHIAGLGSVGSTVLIGLALMGRKELSHIGIFDLNESQCRRWEMEGNQIREACSDLQTPKVEIISDENMFDCDIFVFCVARAVPEVGVKGIDVRMVQFEANAGIVSGYAKRAADAGFQGLFVVVSDPVDLLCKAALLGSEQGAHPLNPGQIQGCGLGVMNARAAYYAGKHEELSDFLTTGRVYGPHGKDLIVANAMAEGAYDQEASLKLTALTINANMEIRDAGFKPYVAPALSSAAYTILRIIRGEWNYSANYLNGVYFGAKNRTTETGTEWEEEPLAKELYDRMTVTYERLEAVL